MKIFISLIIWAIIGCIWFIFYDLKSLNCSPWNIAICEWIDKWCECNKICPDWTSYECKNIFWWCSCINNEQNNNKFWDAPLVLDTITQKDNKNSEWKKDCPEWYEYICRPYHCPDWSVGWCWSSCVCSAPEIERF